MILNPKTNETSAEASDEISKMRLEITLAKKPSKPSEMEAARVRLQNKAAPQGEKVAGIPQGPIALWRLGAAKVTTTATNGRATYEAATVDPAEIERAIRLIVGPGNVTEIRALNATVGPDRWPKTYRGYFDDPSKAIRAVATIRTATGIYFIPNELNPALLARSANRLESVGKNSSTADSEVVRRRYFLVDTDPNRPTGISSTSDEHDMAIERAGQIAAGLGSDGWPNPIIADSGNGAHLLYRVDLPAHDGGLVERCLDALAARFDDGAVKVDTTVHNPARIWKLYGTVARKGDDLPDYPHRTARMLSVPDELKVVPAELLERLAGKVIDDHPESKNDQPRHEQNGQYTGLSFDIEAFIRDNHLNVSEPEPWKGGQIWVLKTSPVCDHHDGAAFVGQQSSGALFSGCKHDSCQWGWRELRAKFEPERRATNVSGTTNGTTKNPGFVKVLSDIITADNHFAQDAGEKLYRYRDGCYRGKAESYIKQQVKRLCVKMNATKGWSTRLANEVVAFIGVDTPDLWEQPRLDVVNVKNGILRLADGVLLPHSQEHLSTVQLPVRYDPKATCKSIDRFIGDVFPGDAVGLAYEIAAMLMTGDMSIQKAILLLDPGGNGKSVYLSMLTAFIGSVNVAAVSLHRLESNRFACARLVGKLANICPDLPSEHLSGTSVFKGIVGGDPQEAERKGQDSFMFQPFSRLVFSANSPPRSKDGSDGFFDRWLVVPLNKRFRGEKREIPRNVLDARLSTPGELSGLLNHAVAAWQRIQGGRLSEPESVRQAWQEFHAMTDPFSVWLNQYTIDDPTAMVPRQVLRFAYGAACERDGRPAPSQVDFGRMMHRARPDIGEARPMVNGRRQWCYLGIGFGASDVQDVQDVQDILTGAHGPKEVNPREPRCDLPGHPGQPGPAECQKCGSTEVRDTPVQDGKRVRRDCAQCGRTDEFIDVTPAEEAKE